MTTKNLYLALLKNRRMLISELSAITGLTEDIVKSKLRDLVGLVKTTELEVILEKPLDLALLLIKEGFSIRDISKYVDWRDFEKVSAEILGSHGYVVITNFTLTRPVRLEIDVVGVDVGSGRSILVDCKHWSKGISRKALVEAIDKHVARIEKLLKYFGRARSKWKYFKYVKEIIPLIVTLTTPPLRFYRNTVAVSIQELNQLLLDLPLVIDTFGIKPYRAF